MWFERIPYIEKDEGRLIGYTGSVASKAFKQANISVKLSSIPEKRQLKEIKDNKIKTCGIGWFKNDERLKFARYTNPIYQDNSVSAITSVKNTTIQTNYPVAKTLKNKDLKLLVKSGYSYGVFLDKKIANLAENIKESYQDNLKMLKLIRFQRADYLFISKEEAIGIIKQSDYKLNDFKFINFTDAPEGNKRYIICSKKVSVETIEKLNKFLPLK
jgi:uncharacterized protein (TIGR02285 family)